MTKQSESPTIVVLGSINMDLIGTAPRLPAPGETVMGDRFYTAPGGKGANQAVAAARLGAQVRMVGRVGDDMFGPSLVAGLRKEGIDAHGVALDSGHATGIALILLDAGKQNHIVAIYGANMQCGDEQVRAAELALDGARALLLQLEIPFEVSLQVARTAMSRGVRVIWDPAPAADFPPEAYAAADIITPNQTEATSLTGIEVTDVTSARAAAEALLERGAATAVVKLGELGAYYASTNGAGHVPAIRVEVSDTVAAGDAFGGALAVALAEGRSIQTAVRYGTAAGTLAVTRQGAQEAMPDRSDVEAMLSRGGTLKKCVNSQAVYPLSEQHGLEAQERR